MLFRKLFEAVNFTFEDISQLFQGMYFGCILKPFLRFGKYFMILNWNSSFKSWTNDDDPKNEDDPEIEDNPQK